MNTNKPVLADFFDKIYVINLASRQDRRDEMQVELKKIGLSLTHPSVQLFTAVRPTEQGDWPSIGARGCFMSHLQVLQDAEHHGYENILILEDDIDFVKEFNLRFIEVNQILNRLNWDIFYGGYELFNQEIRSNNDSLLKTIDSTTSVGTTHFIAFNKTTLVLVREYLDVMISRKGGDPNGGPMHVDGAYSWFRTVYPQIITVIATPQLGYQRSSRTDIHDLGWKDQLPVVRRIMMILRKVKNFLLTNKK